ncbi:MAG: cyclic-phosphate processing receiver domain-containing protein [Isosphaeraceae bacterium]
MDQASEGRSKVLFMDDDPARGASFLAEYPDAVWVQTAEDCIAHLAEPWDEVHLDHDLGGDVFVDFERDDCGMAVVRWLCAQPRAHLAKTWFFVHTHNLNAACLMVLHLEVMGYEVRVRPFGAALAQPARPGRLRSLAGRAIRWLRSGDKRRMAPVDDGDRVGASEGHEPVDLKSGGPGPGGDR